MANRALLVGINAYRDQPLYGCVNDVKDVAQFLTEKCGFATGDVHTLIDAEATTQKIREALENWLLQGAAAGDRLLFHYSGHGSILPGPDRAVHDVICPVDFDYTAAHSLSDEDFRKIFATVPDGVEFNWISDSCHSGDLARGWRRMARALGVGRVRARYLPPPPAVMEQINALRREQPRTRSLARALDRLNGALIAGCQSDETSADATIDGRANGAFTYYLLKELHSDTGLAHDVHTVVGNVATSVANNGYDQHPQIRGLEAVCTRPFLSLQAATRDTQPAQPTGGSSVPARGVSRAPRGRRSGRLAFVVGNGAYLTANPLKNPEGDAREIGRQLGRLGFSVFGRVGGIEEDVPFGKNLSRAAMETSFRQFLTQVAPGDTVLFYYAGHGLQVDDDNYLVPADAQLDGDDPLASLVGLRPLIEGAARAATSTGAVLVFLDSCRDNPFPRQQLLHLANKARPAEGGAAAEGFAVVDQGFATVKLHAKGDVARTFIAFATAPGDFASDGSGDHSPFAAALIEHVATRGLPLNELFARVCQDVVERARREEHFQDPWHESNLDRAFYFSPVTWRPMIELGLLGLIAGLVSSKLLFKEDGAVHAMGSLSLLWGLGLVFGVVVATGVLRWGSRRWRDALLAVIGTGASFAIALAILKAHGLRPDDWQFDIFPRFSKVIQHTGEHPHILWLSATAGVLFIVGMIGSYQRRRLGRWIALLIAGLLVVPGATAVGLACLQLMLSDDHQPIIAAIAVLCVLAGAVYTAGTALALKPQGGNFRGFGPTTGAVCLVGLAMPICFAVFLFIAKHQHVSLGNGLLMYGLGAVWFAAFGAQLGYCFRRYVPEHRRWQPTPAKGG
jgi:uncharacterized caspase-like protein